MRRRLIIEVEDGRASVYGEGGTPMSTGRMPKLHEGRLIVDFGGSKVIAQVVGEALALQPVTDREQVLADAVKALAIHMGQSAYGAVFAALREAGFE